MKQEIAEYIITAVVMPPQKIETIINLMVESPKMGNLSLAHSSMYRFK